MRNKFGDTIPDPDNSPKPPYIFQAFPSVRYHQTGQTRTIYNTDEEAELGDGWRDTPWPQASDMGTDCANCQRLRQDAADIKSTFDKSWKELTGENDALKQHNQALETAVQQLTAQLNQPTPEAPKAASKKA